MTLRKPHRLTRLLPFTLVLSAWLPGAQQASAQALPTATGPGTYIAVGSSASFFQSDYGQRTLAGTGIFADINPVRQVGLEVEAHWLHQHRLADTTESTYLAGPRVQLRRGPFSPYVKLLAGLGRFNFPYDYAVGHYFVVAPGAGLDYNLTEDLKLRLFDVEYQQWPQFTFGTLSPYGISVGFSYRLVRGSTSPH